MFVGPDPAGLPVMHPRGNVDLVVPSVREPAFLSPVFAALAEAVAVSRDAGWHVLVTVCDDRLKPDARVRDLVTGCDWTYLETAGSGAAGARNRGAGAGHAEVIVFMDDDVLLDKHALMALLDRMVSDPLPVAVVGGLRPPGTSARWLRWTYERGTLTPATAFGHEGRVDPVSIAAALVAIRRHEFELVGGFPPVPGTEDALLGLRLAAALGDCLVERCTSASGIHLYEPTWDEWLRRSRESGARLARIVEDLPQVAADSLVEAHRLGPGVTASIKRALGLLPQPVLRLGRGRLLRRAAAAGAEAAGWRKQRWELR